MEKGNRNDSIDNLTNLTAKNVYNYTRINNINPLRNTMVCNDLQSAKMYSRIHQAQILKKVSTYSTKYKIYNINVLTHPKGLIAHLPARLAYQIFE